MEHIVFLDRSTLPAPLRAPQAEHRWEEFAVTTADEVAARIADATMVITNKVRLTATLLAGAPRLKFIAVCATGTDVVDLAACRERGIAVSNIRDYAGSSVPEHVIMLLLNLARSFCAYQREVTRGDWQRARHFCLTGHPIRDLASMTLAIVGSGSLGSGVAQLARGFGMQVWQVDRKGVAQPRPGYVSFDRALREADAITLHCPLTSETRNLIGEAELAVMRRDALLINTGRGGLVDEAALAKALRKGWIGGAGVDVLTAEPPCDGNVLLADDLPNLIVTPHNAWASQQAIATMASQLIDNIDAFCAGAPRNRVA